MRVLLIEDGKDLAFAVAQAVEMQGYSIEIAPTGEAGIAAALRGSADVIVLDIMLPDVDGFEVLERIRGAGLETPVLMLTARGEEDDKLRGFRLGADDYLTKPFGVRELLARLEVLERRARKLAESREERSREVIRFGDVEIIASGRIVRRGGEPVTMRPREMDLLLALVTQEGKVVTRQELLKEVWGYTDDVSTRTVDIHMVELRKKLEVDPANPQHIVTVRKAGYRFDRV